MSVACSSSIALVEIVVFPKVESVRVEILAPAIEELVQAATALGDDVERENE